MKANVLRMPLLKAAGILVIFSLLVYFTSTDPDASVWTSIGTIIVAAFITVQWLLAMAIGLTVCIAFLIAIFLGAVAVGDPAASSRMYEGLRRNVLTLLAPAIELWNSMAKSDSSEQLAALTTVSEDLQKEINAEVQAGQAAVRKMEKIQTDLTGMINGLASRLTALEETTAGLATGQQVEELSEELKTVVESTAGMQGVIDGLEKKEPEQLAAVDLTPLEKKISELQAELAALKKTDSEPVAAAPAETAESNKKAETAEEEHRIFSYFENDADRKKVAELVASTLKKDMSYKQVMDLVAKGLGSNGEIITSHPSLSKDYIRQCRRNS